MSFVFFCLAFLRPFERFGKRISDPARNWKISDADYSERPFWDQYSRAFEDALGRCSTDNAPWFIIPANRKWFRNLAIAEIVVDVMENLNMKYPAPSVDMDEIKRKYHQAERSGVERRREAAYRGDAEESERLNSEWEALDQTAPGFSSRGGEDAARILVVSNAGGDARSPQWVSKNCAKGGKELGFDGRLSPNVGGSRNLARKALFQDLLSIVDDPLDQLGDGRDVVDQPDAQAGG
ncbi:MAG: hypothetical protein K8R59_17210 [Thermoanaerobaculales bacterium]|nr:hypothetical protein [Thermoanaerobaculales bacterium]